MSATGSSITTRLGSQRSSSPDTILDEAGEPAGTKRWWPSGNVVRDNVVQDSGLADLAVYDQPGAGNCFEGNTHTSSAPSNLEDLMPCGGSGSGDRDDGALAPARVATVASELFKDAYQDQPVPDPQDGMSDPGSLPGRAWPPLPRST